MLHAWSKVTLCVQNMQYEGSLLVSFKFGEGKHLQRNPNNEFVLAVFLLTCFTSQGFNLGSRGIGKWSLSFIKGLSTREAGRGHATPHIPVETAKCWWLLKIEP